MLPQLQAAKNWKFRVIICDENGNYRFDDVNEFEHIVLIARSLALALIKEEGNE